MCNELSAPPALMAIAVAAIDSPYETPESPEIHLVTAGKSPDELATELLEQLAQLGV